MSDVPEKKTTVDRPARRPYHRPELVAYGPLAKLTRGEKSGMTEITPQGGKKRCL
jgi:hypothetical protein